MDVRLQMEYKWKFHKYEEGQMRRDSSSSKHFQGIEPLTSLIREFTQNSLDAQDNPKEPVVISISMKELPYKQINTSKILFLTMKHKKTILILPRKMFLLLFLKILIPKD